MTSQVLSLATGSPRGMSPDAVGILQEYHLAQFKVEYKKHFALHRELLHIPFPCLSYTRDGDFLWPLLLPPSPRLKLDQTSRMPDLHQKQMVFKLT